MRILAASTSTDIYAERFLIELARQGHSVGLLCAPEAEQQIMQRSPGTPIFRLVSARSRFDRNAIREYAMAITDFAPDAILTYTSRVLSLMYFARGKANVNVPIIGSRGAIGGVSWLNPPDWFTYLNPKVEAISCMSRAIADALSKASFPGLRSSNRFVPIYQGYDFLRQEPFSREPLVRQDPKEIVLLSVGNDRPIKGIEDVLNALEILTLPQEFRFVFAGRCSDRTRSIVEGSQKLSQHVRLLGFVPNAIRVMGQADIYIQPTRSPGEGIGNAIAEAMSRGLPVITTNAGGAPELVHHEVNGLLVPLSDPPAIAAAIERLLGNQGLRETYGQKSMQRLIDEFSMAKSVEAHLMLIERLRKGLK